MTRNPALIAATLTTVSSAHHRGKRSRSTGLAVESLVHNRLLALGVQMVERIETGWRVIRQGSRIIGARPGARVAGDFRGVLKGGRSVLVECKYRSERLLFSALDAHQVAALHQHHEAGGLSLLAWAWDSGHSVMVWPVPTFGPRLTLQITTALALNVDRIPERTA